MLHHVMSGCGWGFGAVPLAAVWALGCCKRQGVEEGGAPSGQGIGTASYSTAALGRDRDPILQMRKWRHREIR